MGTRAQSQLEDIKSSATGANANIYGKLYRVLFWLGVLIGGVLIIHAALILISSFFTKKLPNILHFPRPELMVVLFAIPAIANAASSETPPPPPPPSSQHALARNGDPFCHKYSPHSPVLHCCCAI